MRNRTGNTDHQEIKGLNENHIRSISTTLGLLEKNLSLIEMYIKEVPCGRMFKVVNKLSLDEEQRVLSAIEDIKRSIKEFADFFNLPPIEDSLGGIIQGCASIYWVNLCDMEPRKLNSYGQVGSDVIDVLNRYIVQLKELLNTL